MAEKDTQKAEKNIQQTVTRHALKDMANVLPPPAAPAKEKWGANQVKSMARLGGHEITQALNAFPDSNIKALEEPGVIGNGNAPQYNPQGVNSQGAEPGGYNPSEHTRIGPSKPQERGRGR